MSVDHVPESELILYAFSPDAVSMARGLEIRRHIAACVDCQTALDFFVVAETDLREIDVWEPIVGSDTHASLMKYGERVAAEDSEATTLLDDFIESPVSAAWTMLVSKRRFHTGGVVRKLIAEAHRVCEGDALAALTFADNAVSVAELLPKDLYPGKGVYQLRGTAWKERANAQMLLGDLPAALDSLDRAERAYLQLPSPSLGLAAVALVRAGVFYEQRRLNEAAETAEHAERSFAHFGDDKRRMDAVFLRAGITFESHDLDTAVKLFRQILDYGEDVGEAQWIARASHGIGVCEVERRNLSEASVHLHAALLIFRELGPEPYRFATEWGIARIVLRGGKLHDAIHRLQDVAAEFERRGLVTDVALVGLDISEAWLALKQPEQIVDLAQHVFSIFIKAGVLTGALSAIAYLKEAAAERRLKPSDIEALRRFLRRAERQPALEFVAPPNPPE